MAKLFNSLLNDVTLEPESALDIVHNQVHNYCKKSWNEWPAEAHLHIFQEPMDYPVDVFLHL